MRGIFQPLSVQDKDEKERAEKKGVLAEYRQLSFHAS